MSSDFARYRRGGGTSTFIDWEFARGLRDWEAAPAPAQVGKRLVEGFLQRELKPDLAAPMTNVIHWGYGMFWGSFTGWSQDRCRIPRPATASSSVRLSGPPPTRSSPVGNLQADVGVRREDPGEGPERPHRLRDGDGRHVPGAREPVAGSRGTNPASHGL